MTRAVAAASVVLLAVLVAPARVGAVVIDEVAEALRTDTVYVDPEAERVLDPEEADEVRVAIGNAGTPIYVAVLPATAADAAGGDPTEVARQLAAAVGRDGTDAVVVGESFRAGSSRIAGAGALADEAFREGGGDTTAVLVDFVRLVRDEAAGQATGEEEGSSDTSWLLPVLLVGGAGVAGLLIWQSSRRRRAEAAERAREAQADRQLLQAELAVLADDVVRVEPQVQLHPEAQSDFDAAVNRYRAAEAALEHADQPIDLVRVERVVAEARFAMDRAKAIVDGRQPPAPPDALRQVGHHGEPAVTLDSDHQPTYVGYPGSFQGGWFGGAGGSLFSGLLLGSMLGWGFGGWGYGGTTNINNEGGDGGTSDGGDWGGGDFGGGDFGGGDFGGGDFGGGDFGG